MRLSMTLALGVCLAGLVPAFAQKKPAPKKPAAAAPAPLPEKWKLEKLTVTGQDQLTADQLLTASGLKTGQLAGKADFEAARQRLLETGWLETVGFNYQPAADQQGIDAKFEVVEARTYPVQFSGLRDSEKSLRGILARDEPLYSNGLPGSPVVMNRAARKLEKYLAEINRPEKVIAKLQPVSGDKMVILFRPEHLSTVYETRFTGNQAVDTGTLVKAMNSVAVGTNFTVPDYRALLENQARPVFEKQGYVRVNFLDVTTEPAPHGVDGVIVTTRLDEGPQYKLGRVFGTTKMIQQFPDLEKLITVKKGEVANFETVTANAKSMEGLLRRKGYLHAQVVTSRILNDNDRTVDVQYSIRPGDLFHFESLTIEGLDINAETEIRKMWGEKAGDPFNAEYPKYFLEKVKEENLFENLGDNTSSYLVNEATKAIDVTLKFKGAGQAPSRLGDPKKRPSGQG